MAKPDQFAGPVMCARTGFHADQAWWLPLKELKHLAAPELTAQQGTALGVNTMQLENRLRQINPDCGNLLHGWLPLLVTSTAPIMAHCDAGSGSHPHHQWRSNGSLQEAYIKGISTRAVDDLVKAMGGTGISKSQVSRLCEEIDERVQAFLSRPIEGEWPYLWIDATYIKSRQGGRIVSTAAIVAVGANAEGKREVLGLATGESEAEPFWKDFLRSLTARGLRGVKLVIADDHKGLRAAATKVLNTSQQRCRVHWMRNLLGRVGKTHRAAVTALVKTVFVQETQDAAREQWRTVSDSLRDRFPDVADLMDTSEEDVLAYMAFPKEHWTQIHSTNPLERLNKEIKRRTNVVGIFPNDAAIIRLVGALLLEQNDEWALARRYMSLESLARIVDKPALSLPGVGS
jgi:putative transposase